MKVVVTGAAGMIGSNLVLGLNALGIDQVIAVDDLTDGGKFMNLREARLCDYLDRSEFYGRFARGEAPSDRILRKAVEVVRLEQRVHRALGRREPAIDARGGPLATRRGHAQRGEERGGAKQDGSGGRRQEGGPSAGAEGLASGARAAR